MKSTILGIATLFFSFNSHALEQNLKDHLTKLDQARTSHHPVSYIVDGGFQSFLKTTLDRVWGDERLSGFCFGVKPQVFGPLAREAKGSIEFDRYPVSWRNMSRTFSDRIYKESRDFLGFSISEATMVSSQFKSSIKGKYFRGCELEWIGSFGGGRSRLYVSEDGLSLIGLISSWSE